MQTLGKHQRVARETGVHKERSALYHWAYSETSYLANNSDNTKAHSSDNTQSTIHV